MFTEAAFMEAPFMALRTLEVGGRPPVARTAIAKSPGSRTAAARRKD